MDWQENPDETNQPEILEESPASRTNPSKLFNKPLREVSRPSINTQNALFREVVETLLLVIAIYTLVNLSTARFVVEGRSMEPNFHSDEFIIVSRLSYVTGEPERGDVIVFHYDEETGRDFIKRIIGLPGDYISMEEGQIFVNGEVLNEPYIESLCRSVTCRERGWYIPKEGDRILRVDGHITINGKPLASDYEIKMLNQLECIDSDCTVSEDQYFVLGDNRNASQDSHDFGSVNKSQIVGKAWVRYWPPQDWGILPHYDYDISIPDLFSPTERPTVEPTATEEGTEIEGLDMTPTDLPNDAVPSGL